MSRRYPVLFLLLLAARIGAAQGILELPLSGRVMDRADVLSSATETALDNLLTTHERETGNQVVVATVPSLGGRSVEVVANRLFRQWELGQAEDDNGVLLLVSRDDRELRIEVGYGLEATLTDARAGGIVDDVIVPRFRDGDFDGGVLGWY